VSKPDTTVSVTKCTPRVYHEGKSAAFRVVYGATRRLSAGAVLLRHCLYPPTPQSLFPSLIPRETKLLLLHLSQLAQLFQYSRTLALYAPSFLLAWSVSVLTDSVGSINIQIMDQFSIPMYLINFNYGWPTPFPASNSQYRPSGPEDLGTSVKSPTHNPAGNYYVQSTGFEQLHLPVLS
jgi:hypothetical protein